jgi:hypothetical protein
MDEQISTWMDWIWSSRCLALSCTSTQFSSLKWAGGGGINSLRHQTSCRLKATETSTVEWSDAMIFQASVHSILLAVASTAHDRWHNCSDAMLRRTVGSSDAEDPTAKTSLVASTWPSDEPLQTRRFIRCYCMNLGASPSCLNLIIGWTDGSFQWTISSSDANVFSSSSMQLVQHYWKMDCRFIRRWLGFHPVYQLDRPLHRRLLSRYRRFIRRCPFFSFSFSFWPFSSQFGLWYFCIHGT